MKKRITALLLCLAAALTLSMPSFAEQAVSVNATSKLNAYSDASKVTYTEATDYLLAAGVAAGTPAIQLNPQAIQLNPQGGLTREQAAKLTAYALLGATAADRLTASVAPFSDVAARRWSAGFIAYCKNQGIISGYGDGTFGPTDKVTWDQYTKMMLKALGYGVNGEFNGAQWQEAAARQAQDVNLFKGITNTDQTTAISREEAFQCTFNALTQVQMVKYDGTVQQYIQLIPATAADSYKGTLGWESFKLVSVTATAPTASAHYWAIYPGLDQQLTNIYLGTGSLVLSKEQNYGNFGKFGGEISDTPLVN